MKKEISITERFLEEMVERALMEYKETQESIELYAKCDKAEQELKNKFPDEDFQFIIKKSDSFVMKAEGEGNFLYRQGFKDCLSFLSSLGII